MLRRGGRLIVRRRRGRWGQRQARSIIQHLAFLRRELAEPARFDLALARLGRHCA
jgi:hypothetical protein